jgi:selenide,water dikinase
MESSTLIKKDLVLIGGGHSHAIALRQFAMNPLPGVRLTLITDTPHTPYSGMLPGYVAGFYTFDECHIDLRRLCRFADAQIYIDQGIGLNLDRHQVICANRPPVRFDYLSIDIGSTPQALKVKGAKEYAIPAKPVPEFLGGWEKIVQRVRENPDTPLSISIVGGGAGGVELALNIQAHLSRILDDPPQPSSLKLRLARGEKSGFPPFQGGRKGDQAAKSKGISNLTLHLFHRGERLLSNHNNWVSRRLQDILVARGIQLHLQESVSEVLPDKVICESGLTVDCDYTIWVTSASASEWLGKSGLATTEKGFVRVNQHLQSVSHPHIFAAGDIASVEGYTYPKAGVFAVRQGKPLFKNLWGVIQDQPLQTYTPQSRYLSLIGTGNGSAIASWSIFGWESRWLWRWKDYIDRKFMDQFNELPSMDTDNQIDDSTPMYCAGCGSKVGSDTLSKVLQRLEITQSPDIQVGLNSPDDCAVVEVPNGKLMVHTLDFFRSLTPDPYIFAQIATQHCLSDIFAMGATPQSVLAMVTIPHANPQQTEETLYQLLSGTVTALQDSQTPLVGGHTTEGNELAFGLACNGIVSPDQILRKSGMQPGQVLILTKAIGTGTLFAADMRYQAKGRWIESAIASMIQSNQQAAQILQAYGATACTDITGFGLLGHLVEMMEASQVGINLNLTAIPLLPGALDTVQQGIFSSLHSQNLQAAGYLHNLSEGVDLPAYPLLFDPQTSGGLLASLPPSQAEECLSQLKSAGYDHSAIIGSVELLEEKLSITLLHNELS